MISRQTHLAEEYIVELDDLRTEAEHLNWFLEFYKHPHSTELAKILDRFIDSDSAAYRKSMSTPIPGHLKSMIIRETSFISE